MKPSPSKRKPDVCGVLRADPETWVSQEGARIISARSDRPECEDGMDAKDVGGMPSGGPVLYWGDLGSNSLQRCQLQGTQDALWACPDEPPGIETVVSNFRLVQGLVVDQPSGSRWHWVCKVSV